MSLSRRCQAEHSHRDFRRTFFAPAAVVLAALFLFMFGGSALAGPPWSDAPSVYWQHSYGLTEAQVGAVAGGYSDGTFRPAQPVTRAEFAKMAVSGLELTTQNPASPTFIDVLPGSPFYIYVETAYAVGLVKGTDTPAGKIFGPDTDISRQQTNTILGRYLSANELDATGRITGRTGGEEGPQEYPSLEAWYATEGGWFLPLFKDYAAVLPAHAPGTAYLILHPVIKGSHGKLDPAANLSRAQAAAMVLRAKAAAFAPVSPYVNSLDFHSGPVAGGNTVVIGGKYLAGATAVSFGDSPATSFAVESDYQIRAVVPAHAEGTVVVRVTNLRGISAENADPTNSYTYTTAHPAVTFVNPNSGTTAGGDTMIIGGTDLSGAVAVTFEGTPATSFHVDDSNHITAVTPAHAAGPLDVRVTTSNGTSLANPNGVYTYAASS
ncbi:MAG: IPT/TIG domain-containing protein [Actinobacteria bacterium]|nr:IPT/TIG domain-containing protein [Actinomycetota bacterium]